jgi:hypothetical protein
MPRFRVRRCTGALALAIGALLFAPPLAPRAAAQGLGLSIGANVPTGEYSDAAKTGVVANAFLELPVPGPLGVRGALFWSRSDIDNPVIRSTGGVTLPQGQSGNVTGNVNLLGASADATFSLGAGPLRPYLIGGVGVYRRRVAQDASGTVEEFRSLRKSDTDAGFNGGVGLRLSVLPVRAFAEVRVYRVSSSPESTTFVPVTIGLIF